MQKLLYIQDLSVCYHGHNEEVMAVNGIDLEMEYGETLGLVGETGAGKTTTALSIMRLLPTRVGEITCGKIEFEGQELLELPEREMRVIRGNKIAMIFQDPMTSLNPLQTVGEQIGEAIKLHEDITKQHLSDKVDILMERVGLPKERKMEYPHQFSGGMKQRVMIAIALACNPILLIADEPTTALDVTIQAQILNMIEELKKEFETSMLLITHDLGVVVEMCDRVAIMYAGEIVETGTVKQIYAEPKHPYTVGLFNSVPNLEDTTHRLTPISGLMPDPTNLPCGCKFHPRCPKAFERCSEVSPTIIETIEGHKVKCLLYEEEKNDV